MIVEDESLLTRPIQIETALPERPVTSAPAEPGVGFGTHGWWRVSFLCLRIVFGLLIVGVLTRQSGLAEGAIDVDRRVAIGGIYAIVALTMALFLSAVRWKLVLGRGAPSTRRLFQVYLIGWFFGQFLPTSIGGDAARVMAVARDSGGTGVALSSVVLERILALLTLGLWLLLGCALAPSYVLGSLGGLKLSATGEGLWTIAVGGCLVAAAAGVVIRRIPRMASLAQEALRLWHRFRNSPWRIGTALLISSLAQGLFIIAWFSLVWGFRMQVPVLALIVFVPLISLASMLPVTLSGLGVREGSWAFLLAPLGVSVAHSVSFSLSYYACGLVVGAAGGVLFMVSGLRGPESPRVVS